MASTPTIQFIQGDTVDESITLKTKAGVQNVVSITAATLRAKHQETGNLVPLPLNVRPSPTPGDLQLLILPADSANIEPGLYDFQIHCVFTTGVEKTWRSADQPAGTMKVVSRFV